MSSCSHNSVFLSSNDAYPYRSSCSHHPSKRKLNRGKIIKAQATLSIMYLHILLIHCQKSCLPKLKEVFQFVWSLQALVCKKILLKLEFTEAFLSLFYKKKIKKRFPPVGCMVWLLQVCVVGVNVFLQFLNFEVLVPLPNFLNELFS